jgi:hypothetical protein
VLYIAQAVTLNIPPPGFISPAAILLEPLPQVALPHKEADKESPPPVGDHHEENGTPLNPEDDLPVAWDLEQEWLKYCLKISQPFMEYFDEKVMKHSCLQYWEAASMADPLNMKRETITPRKLRTLLEPLMGKLVSPALMDSMIAERSACSTLNWTNDTYAERLVKVESFWALHKLLPAWTEYAHLVFLLQPTSACVERSFSILKYIMNDQQVSSLSDKIEASLTLRFNGGIKR